MSINQRMILGMVAAGVAISATVFTLWIGREQNAVLFTDLAVDDAHRALQELEKRGVKSTLAHNGTTILVPASQVHRLRLDLVATGVTGNSVVGYEIINNSSFGMTEQEFDIKRQQALEGELTRTIASLQGVDAARVHLALPKSSIFVSKAVPPTASVVLRLKHQRAVSVDQVAGIQKLIAGSVEGLSIENVTVIDEHGRALTSVAEAGSFSGSDRQLELKKDVELYLTDKAQTLLSSVLGPKKAHVRVDATLNFEQIESQRTTYDPQTVVRSEERNESTDPQTGAATESSLTNYEVNQIVERVMGAAGGIKQL
jgi:flagellar M-ring protein FliF